MTSIGLQGIEAFKKEKLFTREHNNWIVNRVFGMFIRYRSIFFGQVGDETTYASSEIEHFFHYIRSDLPKLSKISKYWCSKSFFNVENYSNLSKTKFLLGIFD